MKYIRIALICALLLVALLIFLKGLLISVTISDSSVWDKYHYEIKLIWLGASIAFIITAIDLEITADKKNTK